MARADRYTSKRRCGGCYYEKYIENGNFLEPTKGKCEVLKIVWEYMIKLYILSESSNNIEKIKESFNDEEIAYI